MIKIPVIHIADATASELKKRKTFNAGLLGTTNLGAYFISTTSSHYDWVLKKLKAHRKIVASKWRKSSLKMWSLSLPKMWSLSLQK